MNSDMNTCLGAMLVRMVVAQVLVVGAVGLGYSLWLLDVATVWPVAESFGGLAWRGVGKLGVLWLLL